MTSASQMQHATICATSRFLLRRLNSNQRSFAYEANEIPTSPHRDIAPQFSPQAHRTILNDAKVRIKYYINFMCIIYKQTFILCWILLYSCNFFATLIKLFVTFLLHDLCFA